MKSDVPLDYAVFQLSPKRLRCQLFVSCDGNTETLASGLVKPFVSHLKVAEEQVALSVRSIKLAPDNRKNAKTWFTKGTLERFVRFVSTPEVLESVNTSDSEMSQLEAARRIYSQVSEDQQTTSTLGNGVTRGTSAADETKKELLRAIDVRLLAVQKDLATSCARAAAAGFNQDTVTELKMFADCFGAHRLNDACMKFLSLCERRMDLINSLKTEADDQVVRSSYDSDMSIDTDLISPEPQTTIGLNVAQHQQDANDGRQLSFLERSITQQQHDEQAKPSAWEQSKVIISVQGKDSMDDKKGTHRENNEKVKKGESSGQDELPQTSQSTRRLSVQDRINMFENKQKENSGSGGKPVVAKSGEVRRLSSDMSSASSTAEKTVLRRWSCASDMSIDLSSEKKDVESPVSTPLSASDSQAKFEDKGLVGTAASAQPEIRTLPVEVEAKFGKEEAPETKVVIKSGIQLIGSSGRSQDDSDRSDSSSVVLDNDCWKDRASAKFQSRLLLKKVEKSNSKDTQTSQTQSIVGSKGQTGFLNQGKVKNSPGMEELHQHTQTPFSFIASHNYEIRSTDVLHQQSWVELPKQMDESGSKDEFTSQLRSKMPLRVSMDAGRLEGDSSSKIKEPFKSQHDANEVNLSSFLLGQKSLIETVETVKRDSSLSKKQFNSLTKVEVSGFPKMKFHKHVSTPELINKSASKNEDSRPVYDSDSASVSSKIDLENKISSVSTTTVTSSHFQRTRQSKGNQERNDELKMKANELEKLYAEHKLRTPGDQSNSIRRGKPTEMQIEQASSFSYKQQVERGLIDNNAANEHSVSPLTKIVGVGQDPNDVLACSFSELKFSEDSRGKLYDRYMEKRDAKLREEWSSNRAEKEAKMKAIHDTFEKSKAEMMAKFSGATDGEDPVSSARRRAERLRSFNTRSSVKREQPLDFVQSEEEGDQTFGDGISRSTHGRRLQHNKNSSSSTPHTTPAPVPKSTARASNSVSGRRRMPSENILAHSVPNFSDLRKENTKPSTTDSKIAYRQQSRNHAHSRNITEETSLVKEEKAQRSHSLRKSSANTVDFKDITINSTDVLTPLKFGMVQTADSIYDKYLKNVESKSSLSKKNGIGCRNDMLGASLALEAIANENDYCEFYESENEVDSVINEDCAHIRSTSNQDHANDESRELKDSPEESPMSWNSHVHHPFTYQHETSDVDASVNSPMGSPASWNSYLFNQTDSDATRMRKKWGSTQKPFLIANSSQNQSRKDVTKGFKRLLKFGRKNRGSENLADWISATTSEGDDDTEDGRDSVNRSSEDLRKSRMGYSRGHPSDDSFNDSEFLTEQAKAMHRSIPMPPANFKLREDHLSGSSMKGPKSFFSLSTFRSKGSESKPR